MKTMLLAIGGNSLIREGERGTIVEQRANVQRTAAQIAGLVRAGYRLVLTHGNGPQVGAALLRSERAATQVPGHPLDVCGACTQGEIGYLLQQALIGEFQRTNLVSRVVTVVTQCLVSPEDPAMRHPTKPVGPFYSLAEILDRQRRFGWDIVEDASISSNSRPFATWLPRMYWSLPAVEGAFQSCKPARGCRALKL